VGTRWTRDFDWILLLCVFLLVGLGTSALYSVSYSGSEGGPGVRGTGGVDPLLIRQLVWTGLGAVALLVGLLVPFRFYEALAPVAYGLCLTLLVLVLFLPGVGKGAHRWIQLGPFHLQPSEMMKAAYILLLARYLSGRRRSPRRLRHYLLPLLLTLMPFALILREPDLGTSMVFWGLLIPMLYWWGFKGFHLFVLLSPLVSALLVLYSQVIVRSAMPYVAFVVLLFVIFYFRRENLFESLVMILGNLGVGLLVPTLWARLHPYQQDRILTFLSPGADRLGAGWQVFQSKIAIGSGGFLGKGYLEGTQKALAFLPARHTDFIFSVVGEELGFLGATAVLALFLVVIARGTLAASKCKSRFAGFVAVGVCAYFFFQVSVNVAMTIGLAPVTGIPLPLLSYGGSSLVTSLFLVGLLLNVGARWYEY
jgi:rod shape determining protein RodA